jgi:ABC-2 type transport system ATP-binding protein
MRAIEVEGVVKEYGDQRVLDSVSFAVDEGEIFGIVGPNGAGKTTLVESIGGLREPDSGSISVLGLHPIGDRSQLTQRLGIQLQESRLQKRAQVGEILGTFSTFYEKPVDWTELASRFGLSDKLTASYASLSGGMKQRLSIALALIGSPQVVILDELTTGLDPRARRSTWAGVQNIRDAGVTVILVTHFMDEVERLCDRVMVLDQGRIAAIDTPQDLIRHGGSEQVMTFMASEAISIEELLVLPDVAEAESRGGTVKVTGGGNMVLNVLTALADSGATPDRLRVDHTSLEDAYLALTGESSGSADSE